MNPLAEGESSGDAGDRDMSPLTSLQTEERLQEALQHRVGDKFLAFPLKRTDSGAHAPESTPCATHHQHHIQDPQPTTRTQIPSLEINNEVHCALIDEIDNCAGTKTEAKGKTEKKANTLTRMWKGMRVEKSNQDGSDDKIGVQTSISKIFQRINPVGKVSRENFSKVFHRIGDALQKKTEAEECSAARGGTLDNRDSQQSYSLAHGEQKYPKIGEKMFRCRPSSTDTHKTTE